jgi:hypothetical protein
MEFEFSHECTNVFGFGAKLKEYAENVNLKKWNLNLATNARMFWIRGETQGQVENVSLRN